MNKLIRTYIIIFADFTKITIYANIVKTEGEIIYFFYNESLLAHIFMTRHLVITCYKFGSDIESIFTLQDDKIVETIIAV